MFKLLLLRVKIKFQLMLQSVSTLKAITFTGLAEGKPYNTFLDDLKDKCLGKLANSPMKDSKTEDEIIIELQRKLNTLKIEELNDTYWEVETGEYLSGDRY